jgi:pyruvate dehydrogenase E1 component beta subunit
VVQPGTDVTLVCSGRLVHLACEVTQHVDASVEVIDLQRLAPLDVTAVFESVARTGRLVIAHDEPHCGGHSTLIQSEVWRLGGGRIDAAVTRVTSPPTPVPAAGLLEDHHMVAAEDVTDAIDQVLR